MRSRSPGQGQRHNRQLSSASPPTTTYERWRTTSHRHTQLRIRETQTRHHPRRQHPTERRRLDEDGGQHQHDRTHNLEEQDAPPEKTTSVGRLKKTKKTHLKKHKSDESAAGAGTHSRHKEHPQADDSDHMQEDESDDLIPADNAAARIAPSNHEENPQEESGPARHQSTRLRPRSTASIEQACSRS